MCLAVAMALVVAATPPHALAQGTSMNIRLYIDDAVATATLEDSVAARDFAALLPLRLTLTDYAVVERIADLPRKLSTQGAPAGTTPKTRDIAYYAPWGNVAFFVGDAAYATGLVRLGRIDSGLPALQRNGPLQVRIERMTDSVPATRPCPLSRFIPIT